MYRCVVKGFKLYQQIQKGHFFYPTTNKKMYRKPIKIAFKINDTEFSEQSTKFSKYWKILRGASGREDLKDPFKDTIVQHQ